MKHPPCKIRMVCICWQVRDVGSLKHVKVPQQLINNHSNVVSLGFITTQVLSVACFYVSLGAVFTFSVLYVLITFSPVKVAE